jgi:membrane protease YdiL (CAAX protease family)
MGSQWPLSFASIRLILLFQLSSLLVREFLRLQLQQSGVPADRADHLSAIAGFVTLGIMLTPLLAPACTSLRELFRLPDEWPRVIIVAFLSGLLLRAASWFIAVGTVFLGIHGGPDSVPGGAVFWWQCPSWTYLVLSITVLAIATPLVEETISRGLILGGLLAKRVRGAVPLSAALFAAFHAPHNLVIAFLFGTTTARMMMRDKRLLGPLVAHATFNGLTVFDWDCLKGTWEPRSTSLRTGIACLLVAATLWAVTMRLSRTGSTGSGDRPGAPDAATRR